MTPLVRNDLRTLISETHSAHPGLLIQRGWLDFRTDTENAAQNGNTKTQHIQRICKIPAPELYQRAYDRWLLATNASDRFSRLALKIEGRLLIGLTGGGALETGCAVSHTWGMPYIPGSSIKGVLRAWAQKKLGKTSQAVQEVFGSEPTEAEKLGLSGLVAFHDAWWIPDSAPGNERNKPFVQDIVTPHHKDYYGDEGATPATDLDSPVPNAMIGVHGSFLFTLEGPVEWLKFANTLFSMAVADLSLAFGAKTRSGYGYFSLDETATRKMQRNDEEARRSQMTSEHRLSSEAAELSEDRLAKKFGTEINATREQYGDEFELFASLVKAQHSEVINRWSNETKNTNKARAKAYRFFYGKEAEA